MRPTSVLAALMASLIAKKTDDARKNGGSPTALDECIAFLFGFPCFNKVHNLMFQFHKGWFALVLVVSCIP